MSAERAAKEGLRSILAALLDGTGSPLLAQCLARLAYPGEEEARPRVAMLADFEHTAIRGGVDIDVGGGRLAVQVAELSGTIRALIVAEDPIAGDGGAEVAAEDIAAAIQQHWYAPAADGYGGGDEGGCHGRSAVVAAYHGAEFVYHYQRTQDAPAQMATRGLAQVVVTFGVTGGVYQLVVAPATDPRANLTVDGIDYGAIGIYARP